MNTTETRFRAGQRAPQAGLYRSTSTGHEVSVSKDEKLPAGGAWLLAHSRTEPDPLTGMTAAEIAQLAEEAYEQRDDPAAWEDIPAPEIAPDVRSVVSVRFNPGELGAVETAARAAGIPLSTYIRNAALNAASPIDIGQVRSAVQQLQKGVAAVAAALEPPEHH
ncbi:hypothetical protein [Actinoplanes sp. TFC3]|uniref:plasmid mobilization protein n=1 Tax=Actinoplanes sp. TFC3 TaxID=1710355 RepID=UPI0008337866|nr:hypothetical protein [Actinoplanes sp. TFC3]